MPLKAGGSRATVSQNIRELHTGKTYAHTASKFGKDKANKQAIAIALNTARKYKADGGGLPNPFEDVDKYVPRPLTRPTEPSKALDFWRHPSPTQVIPIREKAEGGPTPFPINTKFGREAIRRSLLEGKRAYEASLPQPTHGPISIDDLSDAVRNAQPDDKASGGRANETKPAYLGPGYLSRMAFGGLPAPKPPGLSKPVALGAAYKPPKVDLNPSEGIERLALRGSAYGLRREGMINSNIPGRTDKLPMNVKAGSYVLPADIPSALGQGNSMAGGQILKKMFSSGPYGLPTMRGAGHVNMPRMNFPKPPSMGMSNRYNTQFAEGGRSKPLTPGTYGTGSQPEDPTIWMPQGQLPAKSARHLRQRLNPMGFDPDNPDLGGDEHARGGTNHERSGEESADHVPIIAAGGEFIIDPVVVRHIGHGDIKAGHRVLDKFVLSTRKKHIETLKKLKPPKK